MRSRAPWQPVILTLATGTLFGCLPRDRDVGRESRASTEATEPAKAEAKPAQRNSTPAKANPAQAKRAPGSSEATQDDPQLEGVFTDDFERSSLGPNWRTTSSAWALRDGKLCGKSARNHPAWLARRLPVNARIEFEASSASPDGDLKAEFWGDGRSAASAVSYDDATSYLTIFGGWKNRFHVLARLDEHAKNRKQLVVDATSDDRRARPVIADQVYQFKVERTDGRVLRWWVDDLELHSFDDPDPLSGPGHEHFGFNDWEVPVCFDNLTITPL